MLNKLLLATLGTTLISLQATSTAQAVSFSEFDTGIYKDAGSTLATADVISGSPIQSLDSIGGFLDLNTNDLYDADLFKIRLTSSGNFSATITGGTRDGNNTPAEAVAQLFLFDSAGNGIYGHDSTLPANNPLTPVAPGEYFLGITQTGLAPSFRPVSGFNREDFIFPNGDTLVGPNPNVGSLYDFEPGALRDAIGKPPVSYEINLTGATPVPEPSSALAVITLGAVGAVAKFRKKVGAFTRTSS